VRLLGHRSSQVSCCCPLLLLVLLLLLALLLLYTVTATLCQCCSRLLCVAMF
jgi:hypothetical protein